MSARSEITIASVLIAFTLLNYFYLTPTQVVAEGSSPVYPNLVNTMLLCFSLAYLAEGVRCWRRDRRARDGEAFCSSGGGWKPLLRPVALLVVTGAWVLGMEHLGFILATFLFLAIASRLFGSTSWSKALMVSLVMPLAISFVFRGLKAVLPEGPVEELINWLIG